MLCGTLSLYWTASSAFGQQGTAAPADTDWSPFGIGSCHINNRSVKDYGRWVPQMAEIGLREYRSPQVSWGILEREKGKWDWKNLDEQLAYLEEREFKFGALLIGNPKWNTLDPPGSLPVNNIDGWSNYVTQLATHLRGRVRHYEVWNEPPNFTGRDQTPADYARIVVAAYRAAKSIDPDCRVGLAAKSAHINYLEQTILAGAKDHFDYIVLHPYEVLDGIAASAGSEAIFMNIVPVLRKMLASKNPAKVDVPVIFTELGVSANKGVDVQAHALVKAYTMSIAQGVECMQWFEGRDGDSGPLGLLNREGKPRPAYFALKTLIQHLGQHPKYRGWTLLNDRHYAFLFDGAEAPVMIAWAAAGTAGSINFPETVTVVDPMQKEAESVRRKAVAPGPAPVLIIAPPQRLIEEAVANRDKPLLRGRDYSAANEVSIEFGETTVENGLYTRSASHLAEAVVAYGGSARSGSVPGGNVFIVDPGFLSYESVPIEIEVEVRRNPENTNAGFKLVYESPDGFKTAGGWYTIPDNQQWHTRTWRIEDPQFVNYWGYNFVLESDGDKFNQYLIRSVKVRKLKQQ